MQQMETIHFQFSRFTPCLLTLQLKETYISLYLLSTARSVCYGFLNVYFLSKSIFSVAAAIKEISLRNKCDCGVTYLGTSQTILTGETAVTGRSLHRKHKTRFRVMINIPKNTVITESNMGP